MIDRNIRLEARQATEQFRNVVYHPNKVKRVHRINIQNLMTARQLGLDYRVTGEENMPLIPPGRVVFNFA